ncbi:hypothetical protein J6590_063763 [Homalodisca vitripennis]|nr:hypothetical protein J6590_005095 [Homalodisca vitripennis]KAG8315810.1 hypothetical protein J6590_063763 [Homalodisca vitripennis]
MEQKQHKQPVKINEVFSDLVELQYGTAQGGVLGPVMFLILINDMLRIQLNSRIFAYVDGTALVCSAYRPIRGSVVWEWGSRLGSTSKVKIRKELTDLWRPNYSIAARNTGPTCLAYFRYDPGYLTLAIIWKVTFYRGNNKATRPKYDCSVALVMAEHGLEHPGNWGVSENKVGFDLIRMTQTNFTDWY